jgi:hypothetical protein
MKNFKQACFGAATMAVMVAGTAITAGSAQALGLGDKLNFSGDLRLETAPCAAGAGNVCLNFSSTQIGQVPDYSTLFGKSLISGTSTSGFGTVGNPIDLKDLSLVNDGLNQWKLAAPVTDFLSIAAAPNVKFTLNTFVLKKILGTGLSGDSLLADFTGIFTNPDVVGGVAQLTSQGAFATTSGSTYSATLVPVAVPTPALLPGLLGLGAAAWRKRKSQEAAVQA